MLLDDHINAIMYYFLNRVIPIPGFKLMIINHQHILSDGYYTDADISLNEIANRVKLIYEDGEKPATYDDIDNKIHDGIKSRGKSYVLKLYKDIIDSEFIQAYPIITYIDAVVTHYCSDEIIKINGIEYSKEKIRNSLAHGRWFISNNQEIVLFDADPRNINDYNLELIGIISVYSFEKWAINYMESSKKENNETKIY